MAHLPTSTAGLQSALRAATSSGWLRDSQLCCLGQVLKFFHPLDLRILCSPMAPISVSLSLYQLQGSPDRGWACKLGMDTEVCRAEGLQELVPGELSLDCKR